MQATQTLRAVLLRLPHVLRRSSGLVPETEAEVPLRAELFSAEQMERHGSTLAQRHSVRGGAGGDQLLRRLDANALRAPRILPKDEERGLVWLEDFGNIRMRE